MELRIVRGVVRARTLLPAPQAADSFEVDCHYALPIERLTSSTLRNDQRDVLQRWRLVCATTLICAGVPHGVSARCRSQDQIAPHPCRHYACFVRHAVASSSFHQCSHQGGSESSSSGWTCGGIAAHRASVRNVQSAAEV
jgi:hypothetical protein